MYGGHIKTRIGKANAKYNISLARRFFCQLVLLLPFFPSARLLLVFSVAHLILSNRASRCNQPGDIHFPIFGMLKIDDYNLWIQRHRRKTHTHTHSHANITTCIWHIENTNDFEWWSCSISSIVRISPHRFRIQWPLGSHRLPFVRPHKRHCPQSCVFCAGHFAYTDIELSHTCLRQLLLITPPRCSHSTPNNVSFKTQALPNHPHIDLQNI